MITETRSNLARLAEILNSVGMPAEHAPASDEVPFEVLWVALDDPTGTREVHYPVKLFFVEDLLQPDTPDPDFEAERTRTATLQIYFEQPIALSADKLLDTYRLVTIFGRLIPVGGSLGLLETADGADVYYSYSLPTEQRGFNAGWVIEMLEMLQFYLTGFIPHLHAFQTNDQSLEAVAAAIQAELQSILTAAVNKDTPPL